MLTRREDILPIVRHFLAEFPRKFGHPVTGFSPAAEEVLLAYEWEGSERELRNVLARAVLTGKGEEVGGRPRGGARGAAADDVRGRPVLFPGIARKALLR